MGPCCRLSNCQKRQSKKSTHTVCQGMAVYLTLSSAACHPSHSGKKLLLVSISSKHDFFSTYSSIHHDFFAWDRAVQVHLQNIFFFLISLCCQLRKLLMAGGFLSVFGRGVSLLLPYIKDICVASFSITFAARAYVFMRTFCQLPKTTAS